VMGSGGSAGRGLQRAWRELRSWLLEVDCLVVGFCGLMVSYSRR
jgi:hypothetical protein